MHADLCPKLFKGKDGESLVSNSLDLYMHTWNVLSACTVLYHVE